MGASLSSSTMEGVAAPIAEKAPVCPAKPQQSDAPSPRDGCPVKHNPNNPLARASVKEPMDSGDRAVPHGKSHSTSYSAHTMTQEEAANIPHGDVVPGTPIPSNGRGNSEDGSHWLNPTAAQLYRASKRKDKDITGEDAVAVAMVHGAVVEETWRKVLEYESLHKDTCPNPTLQKFEGMYGIPSFKSRIVKLIYGMEPFDRHDWVVDRCGTKVKYIIDYYSVDNADGDVEYYIDTRPAPTVGGLFDRARVAYDAYRKGESWW